MKLIVILVFLFAHMILCDNGLLWDKFGSGKIDVKSVEKCRGHKKRDLLNFVIDPLKKDTLEPQEVLGFNYTLKEDVGPVQMKAQFWNSKSKSYGKKMSIKSANPCQCSICKGLFLKIAPFKTPFEECKVKKTTRYINVDLTELARAWFGDYLIYGTAKIRMNIFTNAGNLACIAGEASVIRV